MRLIYTLLLSAGVALTGDVSLTIVGMRVMPEVWKKEANFATIDHYAREAAAKGADLVMTPEGFLEGYVGNQNKSPDLTREKYVVVGESIEGLLMNRIRSPRSSSWCPPGGCMAK